MTLSDNANHRATDLPATGYVRKKQLIPSIIPVASATLWRMVKAGEFPEPIKLTKRCTAWNVEDIRRWMASKGMSNHG